MSSNLCVDVFRQSCSSRSGLWAGQNRRHRNMSSAAELRSETQGCIVYSLPSQNMDSVVGRIGR